jgi:ATP adenylyltransferase
MWATWRGEYVAAIAGQGSADTGANSCVLCGVLELRHTEPDQLVHVGERAAVILNAYPYTSGHVMVLPYDHRARLADLDGDTRAELFDLVARAVAALETAYGPDGVNFGANLGKGAGAGIPDHLHVHALPRWIGDTNFMTTVGGTRVMPEDLEATLARLQANFR